MSRRIGINKGRKSCTEHGEDVAALNSGCQQPDLPWCAIQVGGVWEFTADTSWPRSHATLFDSSS